MNVQPLTVADLESAAKQLAQSERGQQALRDLLAFLDNGGLSLDVNNQRAVLTLLRGVFGSYTGTARDVIVDRVKR